MDNVVYTMCEDIWIKIAKANGFDTRGNKYSGHETFPILMYNNFTLTAVWRSRKYKSIDGCVYFDGRVIFSYILYLNTFCKISGKKTRGTTLKTKPIINKDLLAIVLSYDPNNNSYNTIEEFNLMYEPAIIETEIFYN